MKLIKSLIVVILFCTLGGVSYAQTSGAELMLQAGDIELVNKIDIYPNPTVDFLHVKITNSKLINPIIKLYNIIGSSIEVEVEKLENDIYSIDVNDLRPGYYLLSIEDNNTQFNELYKFLKR